MANPVTRIILSAVDRTKAAFTSVKGGLSTLSGMASSITGTVGAIFTGLSVAAFVGQVKKAIDSMDDARKSAQAAGTSVENFTALKFAGDQSGVADMQKSLVALVDSLDAARGGTGPAAEAFRALRIDPTQFTDSSDALDALADRFAAMPDGVEKTALAIDLFGKRIGPEMIPLLNQGRDGIRELKDGAVALGVVFSGEAAAAAESFNDNIDKLKTAGAGMAISIANDMLPGLNEVTRLMAEAAKQGGLTAAALAAIKLVGTDFLRNEELSATYRLAAAQRQLNGLREDGFEEDHKRVRQLRETIPFLKTLATEEKRVSDAAAASVESSKKATENRKKLNAELKKSTDEQIDDAERLQSALQSAFSASLRAEEDYLRQAKKLRAEGTQRDVGTDPESQASATLDATIAAMRLQREAGTANLDTVQDQAEALRAMADQLENVRLKEDLRRQANLAEAAALEKAAADENARYQGLAEQQARSVSETETLKAALDGIGKQVSVDIKPGPQTGKLIADLKEIEAIIGRINTTAVSPGSGVAGRADSMQDSLRRAALQYGRRN